MNTKFAALVLVALNGTSAFASPSPRQMEEAASQKCRIDVRSKPIQAGSVPTGGHHVFIIYYDALNQPSYFRGGPTSDGPSGGSSAGSSGSSSSSGTSGSQASSSASSASSSAASASSNGSFAGACASWRSPAHPSGNPILAQCGPYTPRSPDWRPEAPSVTVLTGAAACPMYSCFAAQVTRINELHRGYHLLGPNSNSVAHTLLAKCNVPARKPDGNAPGWGTIL